MFTYVRSEACEMAVEKEGFPLGQNEFYTNVLIEVRLDLRPVQRFSVSRAVAWHRERQVQSSETSDIQRDRRRPLHSTISQREKSRRAPPQSIMAGHHNHRKLEYWGELSYGKGVLMLMLTTWNSNRDGSGVG